MTAPIIFYLSCFFWALACILGQWANNNNARFKTANDTAWLAGFTAALLWVWSLCLGIWG